MFELRWTTDCQPRTKKGPPPHRTTGVARMSCVDSTALAPRLANAAPNSISPMANTTSGTVRPRLTQKRRVMSRSSGWGPSSELSSVSGSSAMPQIGQLPGPLCRICGCIAGVEAVVGPWRRWAQSVGFQVAPGVGAEFLATARVAEPVGLAAVIAASAFCLTKLHAHPAHGVAPVVFLLRVHDTWSRCADEPVR